MHLPQVLQELLGWLAFHVDQIAPFLPTYAHLLLSALFPIYTGAHAALGRPSSAAKKPVHDRTRTGEEDDEEEPVQHMEGLSPSDAIVFPVLAGTTLAGLYFIIKWLEDPALLNKILNWYFATFSILSVARMVSDGLDVLHSVLFPHDYVDGGILFHVSPKNKAASSVSLKLKQVRNSPLPGPLSRVPLPPSILDVLWFLVTVPNRKLKVEVVVRKLIKAEVKIGCHGVEGIFVGFATVLYHNFFAGSRPCTLTNNFMAFGFAYGALQLLSPTTFWTSSLILGGLFLYDIYFVFYTPMMVNVAKSLDIPAKLLFPSPPRPDADPNKPAMSMLGLGDVVLPGIVIGLALRFDLYLHYLKKQQKATTSNKGQADGEVVKAPYKSVAEGWGDQLWTSSITVRLLAPMATFSDAASTYVPLNAFPKPYFHASLVGYVAGMLATLLAMEVSHHPQPALLYLVPGLLGSLWLTALVRGEINHMWQFSDAVEDKDSKSKDDSKAAEGTEKTEGNGRTSNNDNENETGDGKADGTKQSDTNKHKEAAKQSLPMATADSEDRTLVALRVTLPPPLNNSANSTEHQTPDASDMSDAEPGSEEARQQKHTPRLSTRLRHDDGHQDKRARIR